MQMRGKIMEGYVYVDPPAVSDRAVRAMIRLALPHVKSLPPKIQRAKRTVAKGKQK